MPPRLVKRASGGSSGTKRTASRTAKAKVNVEPVAQEAVNVEEVVEVKEEVVVLKSEEKPSEPEPEPEPEADGSAEEEGVKEVYVEDKGERLELEDNETEYDPEEEPGMEYEEEEIENEDEQEEGDQGEEGEDGDVGEDDEPVMIEEEMEDGEDIEGEADNENVEEEQEDVDEVEHHEVVKEHCKRKEFEIFVGGLDKDATESDLIKVFSEVGEVVEVRLMMNPQTKKNKGFAFLRFATVEQAKQAVSELKNPVVNGKPCGISPSQDNDTLFLGNICKTWTKEHLKEKLKQYRIENVEDLTLVGDSNNEGMNRGFAFLEFASRSEATDAYRRLQKGNVFLGVERTAKVAFADSFVELDDEIMGQVKTVFVDGLSAAWDEERVKDYLKKFGLIDKVELARNMPSAKRKDFGFVTFDTHDSAVVCAEGINNAELGEGDNKVKVRARLSRPRQRGRGKRGPPGDFRIGRGSPRDAHLSWSRPLAPSRFSGRGMRAIGGRGSPIGGRGFKRPVGLRDRRPFMAAAERVRHLPPPERSYDRRPPIHLYPKSSLKRNYDRRDEIPPRRRAAVEYLPRVPAERRSSYSNEYAPRGSRYADAVPRSASRTAARRGYTDVEYGQMLERPPPAYSEGCGRDYESLSGSKRPYAALDDVPPRYADVSVRHSRPRLDYGVSDSTARYADVYGERLGRSHLGYGGSRNSLSGQESHSSYSSSRQGMDYAGGSVSSDDVEGMYSSSYGSGTYLSRSEVVGSSYSSLYSGRSLSGSGYLGSSGSRSYY